MPPTEIALPPRLSPPPPTLDLPLNLSLGPRQPNLPIKAALSPVAPSTSSAPGAPIAPIAPVGLQIIPTRLPSTFDSSDSTASVVGPVKQSIINLGSTSKTTTSSASRPTSQLTSPPPLPLPSPPPGLIVALPPASAALVHSSSNPWPVDSIANGSEGSPAFSQRLIVLHFETTEEIPSEHY
ncbi:unnamed protein product [Protopolystoma xenopodis]|uniref:Uncharacterized protein n=1 Tax=Protopolystoma xenopodis TaxID=117903 RepID=A0A3S5C333_9PLAT|nr:unnamed protein product [Protopolystoma xenopodis]